MKFYSVYFLCILQLAKSIEGPVESRSIMNSENAEAQALMTAVGQILEEKMAIHHGLHATKVYT